MTTAHSPLRVLTEQANRIAMILKQAERGEKIIDDLSGKLAASRKSKTVVTFGIVMDDKNLKIEMPWSIIRETSEHGISEYILKQMKGARDAIN